MCLFTNFENDARVDRTAKTLAANGHTVTVFAQHRIGLAAQENVNGYTIVREQFDGFLPYNKEAFERDLKDIYPFKSLMRGIFKQSSTKDYKEPLTTPYDNFNKRKERYYRYVIILEKFAKEYKPDFVHAHDFNTLIAAHELWKNLKIPYIYDSHELWIHRNRANVNYSRLEKQWEERVEKRCIKDAYQTITVCDSIAEYLADKYSIKTPVVVRNTPEPITPSQKKKIEESNLSVKKEEYSLRKEFGFSKDDFVAVYVGRITFYRGLSDIIKALPHMDSRVKLVTLGYFDRRFESVFRSLTKKYKVEDRVFSWGPVPTTEVVLWLKDCDVSLTTMNRSCLSYVFTLPNKLFESIQATVPIIGPDSPEICKIVKNYSCGLTYKDQHYKELAAKVNSLVVDREKLTLLKKNAAKASQELHWNKEKHKLLDLYNTITLQ